MGNARFDAAVSYKITPLVAHREDSKSCPSNRKVDSLATLSFNITFKSFA
jgi:hypothetical protein